MDLRTKIERIIDETLRVQTMKLIEDLRPDLVDTVKHAMKFLLSENPSLQKI